MQAPRQALGPGQASELGNGPAAPRQAPELDKEPAAPRQAPELGKEPAGPRQAPGLGKEPAGPRQAPGLGKEPAGPRQAPTQDSCVLCVCEFGPDCDSAEREPRPARVVVTPRMSEIMKMVPERTRSIGDDCPVFVQKTVPITEEEIGTLRKFDGLFGWADLSTRVGWNLQNSEVFDEELNEEFEAEERRVYALGTRFKFDQS